MTRWRQLGRQFVAAGMALSILAASFTAAAQPAAKSYRVGVLLVTPVTTAAPQLEALRTQLRELGYIEGQNLVLEARSPATGESGLDSFAADLVRSGVDVLVAWTTPATLAAKRATSTVPIVMVSVGDPVGAGLVASLAKPGGNITGVSNIAPEVSGKLLQLLREVRPDATRIAVLRNPGNPASALQWREMQTAATALGVQLRAVAVQQAEELQPAFIGMTRDGVAGVVITPEPLVLIERRRIAELARKARLPTIFQRGENVEAGGLMSYGPKLTEQFRQAAVYVDRILKGARPSDLPVEQPTIFELAVNLKTASTLGLTIPQTLLVRADRVIE